MKTQYAVRVGFVCKTCNTLLSIIESFLSASATSGEGGIRTHGNLTATHAFQASPLDHSGTSPSNIYTIPLLSFSLSFSHLPYSFFACFNMSFSVLVLSFFLALAYSSQPCSRKPNISPDALKSIK